RLDLLQGRADDAVLSRLKSRLTSAATHGTQTSSQERPRGRSNDPSPALLEDVHGGQTLEDLLVQAEIFVQYSLQSKAIERLERIVELFPEEHEHNERLQGLFEAAHWWPQGSATQTKAERPRTVVEDPANRTAVYAPETLRDLGKI